VRSHFLFGTALSGFGSRDPAAAAKYQQFILTHFNTVVFENEMKWYWNEREPGRLNFGAADGLLRWDLRAAKHAWVGVDDGLPSVKIDAMATSLAWPLGTVSALATAPPPRPGTRRPPATAAWRGSRASPSSPTRRAPNGSPVNSGIRPHPPRAASPAAPAR
jgi:hypothetical protein